MGAPPLLRSKGHGSLAALHVCTGKEHFQVRSGKEAGFPDRQGSPQGSWLGDTIPQCPSPLQQPLCQGCAPPELPGGSTRIQDFPAKANAAHQGYWKTQRGKQLQRSISISTPRASLPPCFTHPEGLGQPRRGSAPFPTPPGYKQAEFPAEGMAAMRRRARHLPGANSWPGLCSSAPQTPSTGRIPAASSQAAG